MSGRHVILLLLFLAGCSGPVEQNTKLPFEKYGGLKTPQAGPPREPRIVMPSAGAKFRLGEPISCMIEVQASTKDEIPSILHATLEQGEVQLKMNYPEPAERAKTEKFVYRTEFAAPNRPGEYRIRVEGIDWFTANGEQNDLPPPVVKTPSHSVTIEVTEQ